MCLYAGNNILPRLKGRTILIKLRERMAVPSAGLHSQQSRKETKRGYRLRWNGRTLFPASAWAALPGRGHIEAAAGHRQRWERLPVSFAQLPQTRPLPGRDTHIAILFPSAQIGRQISPLHGGQRSARVRGARSRRGLPLLVTFYDSLLRIPGRAAGGGKSASHQDAMLVQRGHYERNGRPASAGEALPLAGPRPAGLFASGRIYGLAGRNGCGAAAGCHCFSGAAMPILSGRGRRVAFPRAAPAPVALYQLINSLVNLARAFFSMRET